MNRFDDRRNAADRICGIDFVIRIAAIRNFKQGIARDARQSRPLRRRIDGGDNQRIGSPRIASAKVAGIGSEQQNRNRFFFF